MDAIDVAWILNSVFKPIMDMLYSTNDLRKVKQLLEPVYISLEIKCITIMILDA